MDSCDIPCGLCGVPEHIVSRVSLMHSARTHPQICWDSVPISLRPFGTRLIGLLALVVSSCR